jgi:hypothetical protein
LKRGDKPKRLFNLPFEFLNVTLSLKVIFGLVLESLKAPDDILTCLAGEKGVDLLFLLVLFNVKLAEETVFCKIGD